MGADHRMLGARIGRLVGDAEILEQAAIDMLAVVDGGEAVEIGLHAIRQRFVGGVHVANSVSPPLGGHFLM